MKTPIALNTRNWKAIKNNMPGSANFYVIGEVEAGGLCAAVTLAQKYPLDLNPNILALELKLESGTNPVEGSWLEARYDSPGKTDYTSVVVYFEGEKLTDVEIHIVF